MGDMATSDSVPELATKLAELTKESDGSAEAEQIFSVLESLQKCSVTKDILQRTKVGMTVNKLRKHADAKVKELAGKIVTQWKALVTGATPAKNSPASPSRSISNSSTTSLCPKRTPSSSPSSPCPSTASSSCPSSHTATPSNPSPFPSSSPSPAPSTSSSSATGSPSSRTRSHDHSPKHPASSPSSSDERSSKKRSRSPAKKSRSPAKKSRSPAKSKRKAVEDADGKPQSLKKAKPSTPASKSNSKPTTPTPQKAASLKDKEEQGEYIPLTGGSKIRSTGYATQEEENWDQGGRCGPVPIGKTGDKIRDHIMTKLCEAIGPKQEEGDLEPTWLAVQIEKSMYAHFGDTGAAYKAKYRQLAFNLNDKKNPDLNRRLLTGMIRPGGLVYLSDKDLASADMQKELKEIHDFNCQAARSDWLKDKVQTTDAFKCGRCQQRKCTFYQLQTRSSDEPMTIFITCMQCGNKWRQ